MVDWGGKKREEIQRGLEKAESFNRNKPGKCPERTKAINKSKNSTIARTQPYTVDRDVHLQTQVP